MGTGCEGGQARAHKLTTLPAVCPLGVRILSHCLLNRPVPDTYLQLTRPTPPTARSCMRWAGARLTPTTASQRTFCRQVGGLLGGGSVCTCILRVDVQLAGAHAYGAS